MATQFVMGDCVFTKINENIKQYDYLTKDIDTQVIIVGGGVTGALLGYYFSQNNIDCVILEKSRIAHGSTSITTSLLQYELDSNAKSLLEYTSLDNVIRSYQLGLKALDEIATFIREYGNHCCYKKVDSFLYTNKEMEKQELLDEYYIRKNAGLPVECFDETNNPLDFDIKAGVKSVNGGAVIDPYQFTHQLLKVGCSHGLRVYENSEVVKVQYGENDVCAETVFGYKVKGKIIIVATGYNTKMFSGKEFGTKSTTFNIATKPVEGIKDIYNSTVFRDNNEVYHYFRTTADNRFLFGGEDISFVPDIYNEELAEKQYEKLFQQLKTLFPNLNLEVEYKYCGAFASTNDNLGFIGKDQKHSRLWYCLGYGANGILFAVLGAIMLRDLYNGYVDKDLKLFDVYRK